MIDRNWIGACAALLLYCSAYPCEGWGQEAAPNSDAPGSREPPAPGPELLKFTPEQIEQAYAGRKMPEAVEMYLVIARGGQLDGRSGWFHPASSRFSWPRLVQQQGGDVERPLTREQFRGDPQIFTQLDRDRDGAISRADLDWSDDHPWVRQSALINRWFRRLDVNGDGLLTAEEWTAFFTRASTDGQPLAFEQLRDALVPPASGFFPGDMPTKEMLIKGFLEGEIGSLQEGPKVDQVAPDFTVRPLGGGAPLKLSERIGQRPVVLVFGNFTCGPFRSLYPQVEAVWKRQRDNAEFLFVYVREAHPTDGWVMKSNENVGVSVAQPKTFEERQKVAQQCSTLLKSQLPFYVDDVHDAVGHQYSAMPARLYVIDSQGRVAYQSGRGPFGFKPLEMEQALLLLRLEEAAQASPP
ncbi:MAG: deiodinase family protein [Pirellulales bacterium]